MIVRTLFDMSDLQSLMTVTLLTMKKKLVLKMNVKLFDC